MSSIQESVFIATLGSEPQVVSVGLVLLRRAVVIHTSPRRHY